jgi:hypothetical protein
MLGSEPARPCAASAATISRRRLDFVGHPRIVIGDDDRLLHIREVDPTIALPTGTGSRSRANR